MVVGDGILLKLFIEAIQMVIGACLTADEIIDDVLCFAPFYLNVRFDIRDQFDKTSDCIETGSVLNQKPLHSTAGSCTEFNTETNHPAGTTIHSK